MERHSKKGAHLTYQDFENDKETQRIFEQNADNQPIVALFIYYIVPGEEKQYENAGIDANKKEYLFRCKDAFFTSTYCKLEGVNEPMRTFLQYKDKAKYLFDKIAEEKDSNIIGYTITDGRQ